MAVDTIARALAIKAQQGGGTGTSNYKDLTNKPTIEGVVLEDNKTLDDLGIQPKGNYATEQYVNDLVGDINAVLATLTTVGGNN